MCLQRDASNKKKKTIDSESDVTRRNQLEGQRHGNNNAGLPLRVGL
jgi:hypothetical protein